MSENPRDEADDRDPAMTRLMREWGAAARNPRGGLFPPPDDLPRLRAAMDEVDAEIAAGVAPRGRRRIGPAVAAAAAAAVLACAAAWLALRDGGGAPVPALRSLRAVLVVAPGGVARTEPSAAFRTGDRVDLRFETDRPGAVQVAILERDGRLRTLLPEPEEFSAGTASVGPFVFEGEPGESTFVVVVANDRAAFADLDPTLESLREDGRFAAESIPLRHDR